MRPESTIAGVGEAGGGTAVAPVLPSGRPPEARPRWRRAVYDEAWRTVAVARHTLTLLARRPGTLGGYAVMAVVLMGVLRPVFARFAAPGSPGITAAAPGVAVLFSLLAIDIAGDTLVDEREWHTWDRVRSSPVGAVALFAGKAFPLLAVFLVQQAVILAAASLYGFPALGAAARLLPMLLCWLVCVTGCGLLLGMVARTHSRLGTIADIGGMTLSCASGTLVPLAALPHWVRAVAPANPAYWAVRGLRAACLGGGSVYDEALGVLAGGGMLAFVVAGLLLARGRGARPGLIGAPGTAG